MKQSDRDIQLLKHIIAYCQEVNLAITVFGENEVKFLDNVVYRNAISMPILQIGELANHLSDRITQTYSNIPWRAIIGMRNRFAHGYSIMDPKEICQMVEELILKNYHQIL